MTDKPENPPAYPFVLPTKYRIAEAGMTLRDWFAGQALVGIVTAADDIPGFSTEMMEQAMARVAYRLADALLAERAK